MNKIIDSGRRQTTLIADFLNGFATGWYMSVRECHRSDLDIKYSERKKDKVSYYEWTQGPYFCFSEGSLFYDSVHAYSSWNNALSHINVACKIIKASPRILDNNKNITDGYVKFVLYKTAHDRSCLVPDEEHEMTQKEFVIFLKTGKFSES